MTVDLVRMIFEEHFDEVIKSVEESHPDLNQQGTWGMTPLAKAIESNDPGFVEFLIQHGADTNLVHEDYGTPLQVALDVAVDEYDNIDHGQGEPKTDVIEVLLRYGADIRKIGRWGKTAMDSARGYHPPAYALFQDWEASQVLKKRTAPEVG